MACLHGAYKPGGLGGFKVPNCLKWLAGAKGLEPSTSAVTGQIHNSYPCLHIRENSYFPLGHQAQIAYYGGSCRGLFYSDLLSTAYMVLTWRAFQSGL